MGNKQIDSATPSKSVLHGGHKICLMSGALVNAGDFLIEKRSSVLVKHFFPESDITILNRVNVDYSDRIDLLNSFDAIIFSGGPLYQPNLYCRNIPFVKPEHIKEVNSPIFFVGGGLHFNLYTCKFSPCDKLFFDKGVHGADSLGCRDVFTVKFLKHEGYPALLTGCPAWYDLDYVDKTDLKTKSDNNIHKICVSEPTNDLNVPLLLGLLEHLRKRYPNAEITLVNHREQKREIDSNSQKLKDRIGIDTINISGSADGFSVYDDCDLHVGFRVHAHIYNLSRRNLTVLFNEDIRGVGVNTTLGLNNINIESPTYQKKKIYGQYYLIRYNDDISNAQSAAGWMFDDYMNEAINNNFNQYIDAFIKMKSYFINMSTFFNMVKKRIQNT